MHGSQASPACEGFDWNAQPMTSPLLSRCGACQGCLGRKKLADSLARVRDWHNVAYNSVLLADCMGFGPCTERRKHADQLARTGNWNDLKVDNPLFADCMGYFPCEEVRRASIARPLPSPNTPHLRPHPGDAPASSPKPESYHCCKDAGAGEKACRAWKAEHQQADCTSI
jgi:hypothetical protein